MVKTIAVALGAITALAVGAASMPSGQAMLGVRPQPSSAAVTVIRDTPPPAAPRPAPAKARIAPRPAPVAAHPAVAAHAVAPRAAHAAPRPAVASADPAPTARPGISPGFASVASIATLLMGLPQVLSPGSDRPAYSGPPAHSGGPAYSGPRPDDHPRWVPRSGDGHRSDPDHAPGENKN